MRIRGINFQQILLGLALIAALCWNLAHASEIKDLRVSVGPTGTRAEVQLNAQVEYKVITLANPHRLVIDIPDSKLAASLKAPAGAGVIRSVRSGQPVPGTTRIVFDLASSIVALKPRYEAAPGGTRLVIEWPGDGAADPIARIAAATQQTTTAATATPTASSPSATSPTAAPPVAAQPVPDPAKASADATSRLVAGMPSAQAPVARAPTATAPTSVAAAPASPPTPTASQQAAPGPVAQADVAAAAPAPVAAAPVRAMQPGMRPLVVAIDAGHGGQDPGAIGPSGTYEKHVVLAIAKELASQINATPGMRAHLIRDNDVYVERPQRARRARSAKADMFVSIHADAAPNRSAFGSSVYTLSTRGASSQHARWLADRENTSDLVGGVRLEKDTLSNVLLDLAQSGHMKASQDAAQHVLGGLRGVGKTHKAQVEYANFEVLRNADMPAMLVETGFISNVDEEKRLKDPAHQRRLAAAILNGISAFFTNQPPPGTLFAARAAAGQQAQTAAVQPVVGAGGSP
ncbi:N-acetylmuramoyl-L-alanine amidase [Luteimonas sp. RIT-PG2_3]